MKTMKVPLFALLLGLAGGYVLGWSLKPAAVEEAPFVAAAPVAEAPAAPVAAPVARRGSASCEETLEQIQSALADAQRGKSEAAGLAEHLDELLLKAGGAGRDGVPQPWPEGLPARFTKEGFTAAVEELKKACPAEFPPETRANCDEFPCAVEFVHAGETRNWKGMHTCKKFNDVFDEVSWVSDYGLAPDGSTVSYSHVQSTPGTKDIQKFREEYAGNLNKRRRARLDDFQRGVRSERYEGTCRDGSDAWACHEAARGYERSEPEKYAELMARGCELGAGVACNKVAWDRCYRDQRCDDEALTTAERAAELNPDDGKGALDTLAYVLCKSGRKAEADAAYERSCKAGYEQNCGKKCQ